MDSTKLYKHLTSKKNFFLFAGPCVVENEKMPLEIATGVDGLSLETHPDPSSALSDGANMLPLNELESLLQALIKVNNTIKKL